MNFAGHSISDAQRNKIGFASLSLSILILTLNEERNIENCIESVPEAWRTDLFILDSFSTDRTVEIAVQLNANVIKRAFTNYADQRNFGLALDFANDWILMLDADERITHELCVEIENFINAKSDSFDMVRMRRKDMFMGRWLRRSSGYPTYFPRLFRKGTVSVRRAINEEYHCTGDVHDFKGHLVHYPFNKGLEWWYIRHAKYAAMEAQQLAFERSEQSINLMQLFTSDPSPRRAALKQIAYRLPARPQLVFIYLFLVRGGFLDGYAGYCYARMRKGYESMIDTMVAATKSGELL